MGDHAPVMRRFLPALALVLAGCGSNSEDDYKYGASEVRSALEGKWSGTYSQSTGSTPITLLVSQAPPATGTKCGNRELTSTKCISTSSMKFSVSVTTGDGALTNATFLGTFTVYGTELLSGSLDATGDKGHLTAQWNKDKPLQGNLGTGTFTLTRTP